MPWNEKTRIEVDVMAGLIAYAGQTGRYTRSETTAPTKIRRNVAKRLVGIRRREIEACWVRMHDLVGQI